MGKALILSESGGGLYTVKVLHDTTAAQDMLAKLNASLDAVNARLADSPGPMEQGFLNLRKAALEKRIAVVTGAAQMDYVIPAWCADLTAGMTGTVGTCEPGAEPDNGVNIQPGFEGNADYEASRDGQATPFLTMTVADAMRNFALMPAIQKWRPTYRYGQITAIDKEQNTCSVSIDPLSSSIQQLNINLSTAFSDVPIEYMTCNAQAFELGDRVIVSFDSHDWSSPRVIGFEDNPRPCYARYLRVKTSSGVLIYDIVGRRIPTDLPNNPPVFPCTIIPVVDTWLANHVSEVDDNEVQAEIGGSISYSDFYHGYGADDYHIDWNCSFDCGADQGAGVPGPWQCYDLFTPSVVYPDGLKSHTGEGIVETYGGDWATVLMTQWGVAVGIPEAWYAHFNREMASMISVVQKLGYSKALYIGSEHVRSFIVGAEAHGGTELVIESVNPCTPYNPVLYSQFVWPTLKFYSPWETDPVHEEEIFLYPASTVSGEEPGALNIFLNSKVSDKDMVGYCVFTYPVYDKATGLNNYHEDLPYIAFYSKLDIDPQAPPNPFTALSFDPVLSAAVKDMVENYSGGSLTGFSVDFVDIS